MLLGYNTNGWAHHDPLDALEMLAEIGYQSVAITLDHHLLNPYDSDLPRQIEVYRARLERLKLRSVVETGARFLLDPRVKHEPTLVSPGPADRARRIDFLCRAIDLASELSSDCVSLWSGVVRDNVPGDGASADGVWQRLTDALKPVLAHAAKRGVIVGFEPEPGMFIDTLDRFDELSARLPDQRLQLTLDVGHLHCLGEVPLPTAIRRVAGRIVNVHIEDMRAGVHEHLMFGEGEMDFPPVIDALYQTGYRGGLHVELSRHSHTAVDAARQSYDFWRRWSAVHTRQAADYDEQLPRTPRCEIQIGIPGTTIMAIDEPSVFARPRVFYTGFAIALVLVVADFLLLYRAHGTERQLEIYAVLFTLATASVLIRYRSANPKLQRLGAFGVWALIAILGCAAGVFLDQTPAGQKVPPAAAPQENPGLQ